MSTTTLLTYQGISRNITPNPKEVLVNFQATILDSDGVTTWTESRNHLLRNVCSSELCLPTQPSYTSLPAIPESGSSSDVISAYSASVLSINAENTMLQTAYSASLSTKNTALYQMALTELGFDHTGIPLTSNSSSVE